MTIRHSIALPAVVAMILALNGCGKITRGLKKERPETKAAPTVSKATPTVSKATPPKSKAAPTVNNVSRSVPTRRPSLPSRRAMNWRVSPATPSAGSRAVDLGPAISGGWQFLGAAVSRSGRAIVTYTNPAELTDGDATRMAVIDVTEGRIESAWAVPDLCVPLDMHPNGLNAILCRQDKTYSGRDTLYVYRIPSDGSPDAVAWQPLKGAGDATAAPSARQSSIRWARFAGPERVVTLSDAGIIHVWEFPSKQGIVSIPNVVGIPAVSPDGSRVAFLANGMLALLDPRAAELVAIRRVGPLPGNPMIAFRSDGGKLAITGIGKTTMIDLATGQLIHSDGSGILRSKSPQLMPDLAWIDPFLYQDGMIYDFNSSIPIWSYSGIEWAMPQDDRLWVIVRSYSTRQLVLQPIRLPVDDVETEMSTTYSPDLVAVRRGDRVKVDVSEIPADRQAEVRELLRTRLSENGFRPSDQAPIVLKASIDPPVQAAVAYVKLPGTFAPPLADLASRPSQTAYFQRQPARLQILLRNRVLWSTSQYVLPPVFLSQWPKDSQLTDFGGPDYSIFRHRKLPKYVRGKRNSVIGGTQVLAE